jgi:hypothetical protein
LLVTTEEASEEDALYVLTAALLTPAQFPSVLGDDFTQACATLSLTPDERGYGLVLGQDGEGARWTVVVDDASLVAVAIAAWDCGMEHELSPQEDTVVAALPGWPLALTVTAPDLPEPHDPAGPADPLAPPDTSVWGSAQRRLGADEIATQWFTWRQAFDATEPAGDGGARPRAEGDAGAPGARSDAEVEVEGSVRAAATSGGAAPNPPGGAHGAEDPSGAAVPSQAAPPGTGTGQPLPQELPTEQTAGPVAAARTPGSHQGARPPGSPPPVNHPGVHRVLRDLHGYVEQNPPAGRVRSSFAPEGARTLRADGPGWSFVARTDDMAFVLLDEEPGKVLPVGRGPELPALLAALDAMAVRPV